MAFLFCSPFSESNLIYSFKQSKNKTLPEEKENSFTTCLQRKMIPVSMLLNYAAHKRIQRTPTDLELQDSSGEEDPMTPLSRKDRITAIFFFSLPTWNGTTNPNLLYSHIPPCSPF